MIAKFLFSISLILAAAPAGKAAEYIINGAFEGCEHGKYYGLQGGGLLECREYNYFYEYRPVVVADGISVLSIGGQNIEAVLSNGSVVTTKVVDEFEGCDFDKRYEFDNGLIFVCQSYAYSYAYRPDVQITIPEAGSPIVSIKGKVYRGQLYKK